VTSQVKILSSGLKCNGIGFRILEEQTTYNTTLIKKEHVMTNKAFDLEERLVSFAGDIIFFCKKLPNDFCGNYYANQLLRSAGSSALNFGEAQGTQTVKDKIHKLSLSLKELKESRVTLKILNKVQYGNTEERNSLLNELEQLIKIIATIIKNKRQKIQ